MKITDRMRIEKIRSVGFLVSRIGIEHFVGKAPKKRFYDAIDAAIRADKAEKSKESGK